MRQQRKCEHCNEPIPLYDPETGRKTRSDRRYCKRECKIAALNSRRRPGQYKDKRWNRKQELREEEEHLRAELAGKPWEEVVALLQGSYRPTSIARIIDISPETLRRRLKKQQEAA